MDVTADIWPATISQDRQPRWRSARLLVFGDARAVVFVHDRERGIEVAAHLSGVTVDKTAARTWQIKTSDETWRAVRSGCSVCGPAKALGAASRSQLADMVAEPA